MPPPQPIDNGQKSPNRLSVNGLLVARLFSKIAFYRGLHCQQCQAVALMTENQTLARFVA
jgi:hypothetical protein